MEVRLELIADGGAGAESDDFFRSRSFYRAHDVTHSLTLRSDRREATLALIVRQVPGSDREDAISPYGYPGARISGDGPAPSSADVDWSALDLVSIFVRERVGEETWLADADVRATVQVHDPRRPRGLRRRLAEQIRHNGRRGWEVELSPGPQAAGAQVDAFASIYEQTMVRTGAGPDYFVGGEYLRAVLAFERSWLLLAGKAGGQPGAGAIAALSDGVLHYYLGGTADAALGESPFKNVVAAMLDLADELGVPLNLGGGFRAGDGLEEFKRGFANAEWPFRTQAIVCDGPEYERLAGESWDGVGDQAFFPAYRTP
ncbi:MAG: GNAT family N-acetyltransferase [Solirubrobacterales bacterium]